MKLNNAKLFFIEKMMLDSSDIVEIKQILNGYSNYIFYIKTETQQFYLRIAKQNHLINRHDEKISLNRLGIKYYYYDDIGNMIRDWFDGIHNESWDNKKIVSISYFLNKLHNIDRTDISTFNYRQYEKYILNTEYEHYYHLYLDLVNKYQYLPLCVCHNDLNPGNILYNGSEIVVLDFERVRLNTKYFDFANLAREDLDLEQIKFLCEYNHLDFDIFLDHLVITCIYALQWTLFFDNKQQVEQYQIEVLNKLHLFMKLSNR